MVWLMSSSHDSTDPVPGAPGPSRRPKRCSEEASTCASQAGKKGSRHKGRCKKPNYRNRRLYIESWNSRAGRGPIRPPSPTPLRKPASTRQLGEGGACWRGNTGNNGVGALLRAGCAISGPSLLTEPNPQLLRLQGSPDWKGPSGVEQQRAPWRLQEEHSVRN